MLTPAGRVAFQGVRLEGDTTMLGEVAGKSSSLSMRSAGLAMSRCLTPACRGGWLCLSQKAKSQSIWIG